MLNAIITFITSRFLWGIVGVGSISMIIWFIGPYVAVGDYRPLESTGNRQIAIAIIAGIWLLFRLIAAAWRARRNRQMLGQMAETPAENAAKDAERDDPKLVERFEEATRLLKKARFSHQQSRFLPGWLSRFGRQYLYQLPWYVLLGAPGAGKTTALVNSGIHFPLADRFGKTALRGIGGTRHCDWWFTENAVLLDTAGRYTTQESHPTHDAQEWGSFLGLLKKYRPRQPINGVIITVSLSDLMNASPEERHEQAQAQHKRLVELRESLKIDFPVYIMVSKVDLLRGFLAYFSLYSKEQRSQIWGFTFARQDTQKAGFELLPAFEHHFTLLQQRLNAGLADTMLAEQDQQTRTESYLFPQAFARLRQGLGDYLNTLFTTSSFEAAFTPRGIYFTSGTQDRMPFDKMMSEMNDTLHLTPNSAEDSQHSEGKEEDKQTQGKSYFLKKFLEDVVFREADLASSNRWWIYRNATLHWVGYLLLSGVFATAALFWYASYTNNHNYLKEVTTHIPVLERQGSEMELYNYQDIFTLLPYLNRLAQLGGSTHFSLDTPPLNYRLGLYRGAQIDTASQALYQKALKNILLPYVAWQVTTVLRNDMGGDADFSFEALKAYRMLYEPEHYDGKFLRAWIIFNLHRISGPGTPKASWDVLDAHLQQLLDERIQSSPYVRDAQLEQSAQQRLSQAPLSVRIYGRLKRILLKEPTLKTVSLLDLAGPQVELAFRRKSGKPAAEGIPGLYTPKGYWLAFNKRIDNVTQTLLNEDGWVMNVNDSALAKESRADLLKTVRLLYMQDFISAWETLLGDIELKNIANLSQRINTARLLSAGDSPLRNFLINVVKNIKLTDEQERTENGLTLSNGEKNAAGPGRFLDTLFYSPQSEEIGDISSLPEQVVIKHFAPIIELAASSEEGAKSIPFDTVLKQADGLYNYLIAVQSAANSGMAPPPGEIILALQAESGRLPQPFKDMMSSLAVGASSDSQMKELEGLQKRVGFEAGSFCRQAISGRYPLVSSAQQEIASHDFSRMFAPNSGIMDSFFRQNLEGKVDTSRAVWRFNPGVDGKTLAGGGNMLRAFQQARDIRDTWFSGQSQKPSYHLTLKPVSMDAEILSMTLDIDGQVFHYSHGPLVPLVVSWPGTGNTNQVSLQLSLVNGKMATLVTSGDWALNRLIDKATLTTQPNSLSQTATFNLEGQRVVLELTPDSIRNPFQPTAFNCP
ncbi:type VI secretion system protein ImpL [Chania multitudinisentens RB-25]|uniref:Type VI secretion system protein ImpL n=1 Tax=Chania multitudinisentens RB-25 TaxID=1441930 RepID=W0LEZ3_9GAMM|nr:type VI secretion system membrane subunit TssM [Chania multitudinisentens]AHG20954.1 type VI secretion system protein ImpL [Chania multitudinisentens RB-25]